MANTDPKDKDYSAQKRWSFVAWLQKYFTGGGSKFILSPGQQPLQGTKDKSVKRLFNAAQGQLAQPFSQERMRRAENKLKMWNNSYRELVEETLKANFHPENYTRMRLMPHTSSNLLFSVIKDVSLTYAQPATRTIEEDQKPAEMKQDNLPIPGEEPPIDEGNQPPDPNEPPAEPPVPPEQDPNAPPGQEKLAVPPVPGGLATGDPDVDALSNLLELGGSDKEKNSPLDKWTKLSPLDAIMETVEWYARFMPVVWVRPMVRYEKVLPAEEPKVPNEEPPQNEGDQPPEGEKAPEATVSPLGDPDHAKLDYIIYLPDVADIVEDPENPGCALAWWYWGEELDEAGRKVKRVHFFTPETYFKLDEQWRELESADNDLQELPVVPLRLGIPYNSYFLDGQGDDLYEGTLELAFLRTIQNARARDSGFKQLSIQGSSEEETPVDAVMGGPSPIYTTEGGSVNVIDLQPNLTEWTELCRERGQELAGKYGSDAAKYKEKGTPQSGFAKKLDFDKILKENLRTRKFFVEFEKALYKKTRKELEVRPVAAIGELPDKELCVDFAEPDFSEDPKTQAETDAKEVKLNFKSIIDILRRENPDLSEKELVEKAFKNKKVNEALVKGPQLEMLNFLAKGGQEAAAGDPAPPGGNGGVPGGNP